MLHKSLSVIIPAFNEEGNIGSACEDIARLAERYFSDYEILVIDDASQDATGEIVRKLQGKDSRICLLKNPVNRGLGYNYRIGILNARYDYAIMIPGDNEVMAESLGAIFQEIGSTDVIICYSSNPQVRSVWRQWISQIFTWALNLMFGLKVRYYNGPSVIRVALARRFAPYTASFAYMAVILVQVLKLGVSYKHMSFTLREREHGKVKAFRINNMLGVIRDIISLFLKVNVTRKFRRELINREANVVSK